MTIKAITGRYLFEASHRAKGPSREAPEHEPVWADKPARTKAYWQRLAAMVRRKVKAKS